MSKLKVMNKARRQIGKMLNIKAEKTRGIASGALENRKKVSAKALKADVAKRKPFR